MNGAVEMSNRVIEVKGNNVEVPMTNKSWFGDDRSTCFRIVFDIVVVIFLIGIIIILPATLTPSFHYVKYDEMCFAKNKYGGTDTSKIIMPGRNFLPLNYGLVCLPSTYRQINYYVDDGTGVVVISQNGLQFNIDVSFRYRLTPENLEKVYNTFSTSYDNKINTIAKSIIKDKAGGYSPEDYISKKKELQKVFALAVKEAVESQVGVEVPLKFFFLEDITFPATILTTSLNTVLQTLNNDLLPITQQVEVIKAETLTQLSAIQAQSSSTLTRANLEAAQIINNSVSYTTGVNIKSKSMGIFTIADNLNITESTDRAKFAKIMNLYDVKNTRFIYGNINNLLIKTN